MTSSMVKKLQFNNYKHQWEAAFLLPGERDLVSSAIRELGAYFPALPAQEIQDTFFQGQHLFAEHWHANAVNPRSEESLCEFYNSSNLEIFELMYYHHAMWDQGPLDYVCALELAKQLGCHSYLDYGSGVGSGAMVFANAGITTSLCDISSPLLEFAKWRFALRGLRATFVDLKTASPRSPVDLITCFEVLEHVRDPLGLLRKLNSYLRDDGLLIATAPFEKDDLRPMHIIHNPRLIQKFRGQGFQHRWDLRARFKGLLDGQFYVMQKVKRSPLQNKIIAAYDYYIPHPMRIGVNRLKKALSASLRSC